MMASPSRLLDLSLEERQSFALQQCGHVGNATVFVDDTGVRLYCDDFLPSYSILTQAIVLALFGILIVLATVGNLLVVWVIWKHKVMHNSFSYFLANMAIADLLIATLNVGSSASYNTSYDWKFGDYCAVANFIGVAPTCVSVFSMTVLSWDRCVAVVSPLRRHRLSTGRALIVIGVIWFLSLAAALPYFLNSHVFAFFVFDRPSGSVSLKHACTSNTPQSYAWFLFVIQYALPLCVLSVTYARIAWAFRRGARKGDHNDMPHNNRWHDQATAKRKVVKMLALVVAIFMVVWAPYHLYFAFFEQIIANQWQTAASAVYLGCYGLAMSSSFFNPIVYCFSNARFRIGFRWALRWAPCVQCDREEYTLSRLFPDRLKAHAVSLHNKSVHNRQEQQQSSRRRRSQISSLGQAARNITKETDAASEELLKESGDREEKSDDVIIVNSHAR